MSGGADVRLDATPRSAGGNGGVDGITAVEDEQPHHVGLTTVGQPRLRTARNSRRFNRRQVVAFTARPPASSRTGPGHGNRSHTRRVGRSRAPPTARSWAALTSN